jgi:hypothetical protein
MPLIHTMPITHCSQSCSFNMPRWAVRKTLRKELRINSSRSANYLWADDKRRSFILATKDITYDRAVGI